MKDIANYCKVSTATVSLALNDSNLVNRETKQHIQAASDDLGYIPNEIARSLVKKRSYRIGVIVPDILNSFYATFVTDLNRYAEAANYSLSIYISNNSSEQEKHIVDELIRNRVEGVIIVPINEETSPPQYITRLTTSGIPFLFAVDRYENIDSTYVISDYTEGMIQIVEHLIECGYQDIAYLNGDLSVYSLKLRRDGYIKALEHVGLASQLIDVDTVDYNGACKAITRCISEGRLHRAFVCPNDMMALGVINTLYQNGILVPEHCAVTGFDNVIFSEIAPVSITTVKQDIPTIAQKCLDLILSSIHKNNIKSEAHLIRTSLIIRNSC